MRIPYSSELSTRNWSAGVYFSRTWAPSRDRRWGVARTRPSAQAACSSSEPSDV